MLKCIYIIPDSGNFEKRNKVLEGGSSSHISIGIQYLGDHFRMQPYVLHRSEAKKNEPKLAKQRISSVGRKMDNNQLRGALRDIIWFVKNHLKFFTHYRAVKNARPDFIYERAEYLNINGIIIAKLLRIPHFYEVNWVHYLGIQQFYRSYLNGLAKWIEERMYQSSNHSFFIGNQNKYLHLKSDNWSVVQNGVGGEIVERFSSHRNCVGGDTVEFCVLANLMPHHRFDILAEALLKVKVEYWKKIRLHLIGFHFQHVLHLIPTGINYIHYGPKNKEEIYFLMYKMNAAIISGGPHYSSFMKLYDYGAAKMAVICPELENIVLNFSAEEILFFKNEDPISLSEKIMFLIDNPEAAEAYGNSLYNKVKDKFTWERIFLEIRNTIEKHI